MFKGIGIFLVSLSIFGVGVFKGFLYKHRYNRLKKLCVFIEEISDRIRTGEELYSIVLSSGKSAGVYIEQLGIKVERDCLLKEDISVLEEFFSSLGMGDTQSQIKRCETYLFLLRKKEEEADQMSKQKCSLYAKLGFFAGLGAAIILI